MTNAKTIRKLLSMLLIFVALPLAAADTENYLAVTGPCNLEFPQDHGAHPGYRTEWWYYTGNLRSKSGRQFGFQLTFFRSRISPRGAEKEWPAEPSAWRSSQVYLAHAALSDVDGKRHMHIEDVSRAALGLAGVRQSEEYTEVFLKNWFTRVEPDSHTLNLKSADFSFKLTFRPKKPLVFHGDRGYDIKGSTPERASCYYSFTRLTGQGEITMGGDTFAVTGQAWMDHEFSTASLEPGITGWDWFSLQLSDNSEIMVYLFRTKTGGIHSASSGTYVRADSTVRKLIREDIMVDVMDTWQSKQSKARYPVRWRLQIAALAVDLKVHAKFVNQEMRTLDSTGVTYWEGSVAIDGIKNKQPIKGEGYVELTGYAEPFDAPI
jgi:predicted secreted hydrolase